MDISWIFSVKPTPTVKIGDHVLITDGSSDGHTGIITDVKQTSIRVKRDLDGKEVTVSHFEIIK